MGETKKEKEDIKIVKKGLDEEIMGNSGFIFDNLRNQRREYEKARKECLKMIHNEFIRQLKIFGKQSLRRLKKRRIKKDKNSRRPSVS